MTTTSITQSKSSAEFRRCEAFSRSAAYYDAQHSGRDYDRDLAIIATYLEAAYARLPQLPRNIIDWGAGTGEHVRRWKQRGFTAVGFDASPGMAMQAQAKGNEVAPGDICETSPHTASPGTKRNATIGYPAGLQTCLFASFSYATADPAGLAAALDNVRQWSEPGGLFVFDVVSYAGCASSLRPQQTRRLPCGEVRIKKTFNPVDSLVTADLSYDVDGDCFTERHLMRAYTPRELESALFRHRLEPLAMLDPETGDGRIRVDSYYFMVVARVR